MRPMRIVADDRRPGFGRSRLIGTDAVEPWRCKDSRARNKAPPGVRSAPNVHGGPVPFIVRTGTIIGTPAAFIEHF